jgi:hypothetical protein
VLVGEMLSQDLVALIRDRYGNYVIQSALKHLGGPHRAMLVGALTNEIEEVKSTPWGLQIISKMCSDST